MKNNKLIEHKFEELRKHAEKFVQKQTGKTGHIPSDIDELIYELKVYHTELEIQNEELKRSQQELTELYYKYENLYETAPCGYLTLDANGVILDINKKALEMLGKSKKPFKGSSFTDFIHNQWIDAFITMQRKSGQTGENQETELLLKSNTNSDLWVHTNIKADRDNNNEVYNWKLTLVDITLSKNYEKELIKAKEEAKESQDLLKQAQQTVQLGHWKLDVADNTMHWSDEIYLILDSQPQEFEATYKVFFNFIHPDDRKKVNKAHTQSTETGKPYEITYRLLSEKGKTKYVQEKGKTTFDETGKPLVSNGVVLDITKLKEQENQLEKYSQKLEEANATKDQFISILGHDLKNSFNALLGFSELLLSQIYQYDKEDIKKHVETIYKISKQTYNLLNNLLEWSQSQRNKIPFNPEITNLYPLVYETYMLLNESAKAKQIGIHLDVPKEIEAVADSQMIKTVIRNLLSNAIKFTPEHGLISILASKNKKYLQIEISDTGTGMNQGTLNSLFEIGKIESKPGTTGERGTGFGLLLCKEFIDKHKGKIWAESELGKGSTFKFTLPTGFRSR